MEWDSCVQIFKLALIFTWVLILFLKFVLKKTPSKNKCWHAPKAARKKRARLPQNTINLFLLQKQQHYVKIKTGLKGKCFKKAFIDAKNEAHREECQIGQKMRIETIKTNK